MARYNSALISNTITGAATIGSPYSGAFTQFTGTAPYTVTLPTPVAFPGVTQTFYNATSGTVTLSTPAGNFVGTGSPGTSTVPVYAGNVITIISDGSNYVVVSEDGSPLTATTGSFSGNVTINGGSATLSVTSSVVTMAPTASSTIDNIAIGSTTRASGAFTTLTANNAVTLTANTASSSTGTGSLVVTGGIGASGTVYAGAFNGNLTGTLQTAAQPNITSTGSLTAPGLTVDTTTLVVDATNDRVGVGTAGPGAVLHVVKTVQQTDFDNANQILQLENTSTDTSGNVSGLRFRQTNGTNAANSFIGLSSTGSSSTRANLIFASPNTSGNATIRMSVNALGQVLIGTTSTPYSGATGTGVYINGVSSNQPDLAALFVAGAKIGFAGIQSLIQNQLVVYDNTAGNPVGSGGAIAFGGNAGNGQGTYYAAIESRKDNGTAGAYGASLNFYTRPDSGYYTSPNMTISSGGNVGIGTTTPLAKLHINAGSGAISIRDYKSIVYNLDASILEGQTYQRFSIGINTSVTTYPRTSAYVRVTVVPNPDGGIGLVHSSTAEFSIWRIDGNNNANFKTISVANGTIGIATPVASGNTVIFGFTMQNNGTGTTPSFTIRIEIIAADVGNYVITPITSSTAHTGANLSGVSMPTNATSAYFGGTPYASIASGSQVYTSANAASNPNGNEANAITGWVAGYAGQVPTSVGTDNGVVPYAGAYQLKFTGSSNGFRSDYGFQATAGRRYSVSFWGNQYQGQYYYIGYIATTAGSGDNYGQWVNLEGAVALNNVGWTQYQFVFTATLSQTYYLSLRMATGSSPSVIFYLDNISITELQGSNIYANSFTAGGTSLLSTVTTGLLSVSPPAPIPANVGPTLGNNGIRVFGQNPTVTIEGDSNSYYPFFINKGVNGTMTLGTYYSGGWYDSSGSQHSFTLNGGSPALTLTGNGLQIDNQKTGNIYGIHQVHSRTKTYNVASGTWLPVVFVNHTCSCNVNIQVYHPNGVNNGSYMWSGVIGGGYGSVTTTQIQTQGLGTSYITGVSARYNNAGYNLEVQVNGTFGGNNPIVYVSVSGLSYGTLSAA